MSIGIKDMSKFYHAFNELCNMYNIFDSKNPDCKNYLGKAKKFVEKYDELNEDYNNVNNHFIVQNNITVS
ncbi:hypothetical protein YYC_05861 [Plasmodium yoelii 17X]|uniref:Plasmodium variant antigen protein Cir/Yir/Bir n=1 Tax=Plasmodium yoelii 17X TaxID=1323249 RepID=V7PAW1_PLAYE|nr:hypothetical protein YYC_05861 [Plasmodium yoelii 17X]